MQETKRSSELPEGPFSLLPMRRGVIFPGSIATLPVGRRSSLKLVRHSEPGDLIGLVAQTDDSIEEPGFEELHPIGVLARVQKIHRKGGYVRLVVEGLERFRLVELTQTEPFLQVRGEAVEESVGEDAELLVESLHQEIRKVLAQQDRSFPLDAQLPPGRFADLTAALLSLAPEEELQVLLQLDVSERLRLLSKLAGEWHTRASLKKAIEEEVQEGFSKNQRDAILREQLKAIKKQLGEGEQDELQELRSQLEEAGLPQEVWESAQRELQRLESMPNQNAESGVIRKYLEWLAALPWDKRAEVSEDLDQVEAQLEADHHGLQDVKRRILEHLAVKKMSGSTRGNILCLVGPPGVGKTSLGRSIAEATERPFVRISLGGVRDEAEIRGHRRTYVGALPGRIISALKKAEVKNPVFLLDEIDKLGRGWMGDPQAALLEVLDPEQNDTFTDHYLEHPFDLSEVFFICTANSLESLSPPLRDRLEIVELSGYTVFEKIHIAEKHLLPKQLEEHGLHESALQVPPESLQMLIREYTREAGVRQLNRELQRLCRGLTLDILREADSKAPEIVVDEAALRKYLGKARFFDEVLERTSQPGVATGLAWTPVGGDILFIETTRMPGKGRLEITGQLGDVMQESARAALTYIRSHANELKVDPGFIESDDLHIHVPAGAVPKDGPSAGITIFSALSSLLTGRKIRSDTAMTGECTLRGKVLPVGGIKAKVLAAHRAGLRRVILPIRNERDLDDVPQDIREEMEFILASDMKEVLDAALETPSPDAEPLGFKPANERADLAA